MSKQVGKSASKNKKDEPLRHALMAELSKIDSHEPLVVEEKVENFTSRVKENIVCYGGKAQKYYFPEFAASFEDIPFPPIENPRFTFIDLFAGIGGFRLACQSQGGRCVFSSELDNNAQTTYMHNYGEMPFGDITLPETKKFIPENFDVLCGGFPCQAFSVAGHRGGFEDTRGTLFFDVAEIVQNHKPKVVFLENVKGLLNHKNGHTWTVIKNTLQDIGYHVDYRILNSMEYGDVPQTRERVYIICLRNDIFQKKGAIVWPDPIPLTKTVQSILEDKVDKCNFYERFDIYPILKQTVTNPNTSYQWRRIYVRENKNNVFPTLTANMGTGGHNVPLVLDKHQIIRKITPKECSRIQGFPENFVMPRIAASHLYKQFGNSVSLPVIKRLACAIVQKIL
ncbi:MAG: DNA (cytosine-5-)-methyltransferase [Akkermansia sp.]